MADSWVCGGVSDEGGVVFGWQWEDVFTAYGVDDVLFEVLVVDGVDGADKDVIGLVGAEFVEVHEHNACVVVRMVFVNGWLVVEACFLDGSEVVIGDIVVPNAGYVVDDERVRIEEEDG